MDIAPGIFRVKYRGLTGHHTPVPRRPAMLCGRASSNVKLFLRNHLAQLRAGSSLAFQQVRNASLHFGGGGKTRFYRVECRRGIGCAPRGSERGYARMFTAYACVCIRVYIRGTREARGGGGGEAVRK